MLKNKTLIYEYLAVNKITKSERDFYNSMLTEEEKKYVEQLKLENQKLLHNHPFNKIKPALMAGIEEQEKENKKRFSVIRLISIPAFACLCFILITLVIGNLKNDPYQSKGNNTSTLLVYELVDGTEIKLLNDLSYVKSGAFLQLGYKITAKKYGLIISVDSNKLITYHLKSGSKKPVLLQELNEVTYLPYSYRLDNTPGFELFLFITSDEVFTSDVIINYIIAAENIKYIDFAPLETVAVKKILLLKETMKNEER